VLEAFERRGQTATPFGILNRHAARLVLRARDQLVRALHLGRGQSSFEPGQEDTAIPRALLAAFPDRVARRRAAGSRRGIMVGGRGVRLAPSSGVNAAELFVCIDVDASHKETMVRQASAVRRDWLPAEQVRTAVEVGFDAEAERVTAFRRKYFEDLLLEETAALLPADEQVAEVLANAAAERLMDVLPPPDSAAGLYLTRVRCLRQWLPELSLPAYDDAELRDLLPWLCPGCRSFADLRKADWLAALQGKLTHSQRQAVEREAPERLEVPSGSHITLQYDVGRPPVLAVRVQEMFGLPASGPTPMPRCARICAHVIPNTPGRKIRLLRRRSTARNVGANS
jgi:ATP-dependent helicase HrpB